MGHRPSQYSNRCPGCGMWYEDFRTRLTYREVYSMLWSGSTDSRDWKYKRRHTVLGKWHQIKEEMWAQHQDECFGYEAALESYIPEDYQPMSLSEPYAYAMNLLTLGQEVADVEHDAHILPDQQYYDGACDGEVPF